MPRQARIAPIIYVAALVALQRRSATVLHGDWRVVPPLRGATYHLKGDLGKLESNFEHPYRRSTQNGDSVEAPDSAEKGGGVVPGSRPSRWYSSWNTFTLQRSSNIGSRWLRDLFGIDFGIPNCMQIGRPWSSRSAS